MSETASPGSRGGIKDIATLVEMCQSIYTFVGFSPLLEGVLDVVVPRSDESGSDQV